MSPFPAAEQFNLPFFISKLINRRLPCRSPHADLSFYLNRSRTKRTNPSAVTLRSMDALDRLPDPLVIDILNRVGDVKTLIRCRSVSKRVNSLVPLVDSLLLRLDQIHSPELSEPEFGSPVVNFFRSLFKPFQDLLKFLPKPAISGPTRILTHSPCDPVRILSRFDRIQCLDVELPGGDMKLEKGAFVKWKAEFGRTLRSCVIVAFRSVSVSAPISEHSVNGAGESDSEFVSGLKTRVVWTISALMAASARHFLMKEVAKEREEMERLIIRDGEGEGTLVMEAEGLREYRETEARGEQEGEACVGDQERGRTVVPSVKMSMRHAARLRLKSGLCLEGATLVVVRPSGATSDDGDAELATSAFGTGSGDCMYGEAVAGLLKCRRNVLEMNSF